MANQIKKYVWLIETIHKAGKISFEEINRKWLEEDFSEGVEIPKRTFHKWRIAIEDMFGLIIENEKGGDYRYFILNSDEIRHNSLSAWLVSTISTSNSLINNKSLKDRIVLENIPSGREYLQPILDAMKQSKLVSFTYYNYWRDDYRQHCVEPYCVKLFRQRWYLVGKISGTDAILIYSLDRMSEFRMSERTFKYPEDFDGEYFFKDCYGIIAGDGTKLEHVVLKVSAGQANYLRDLPLHQSQRETEQNDEYCIFELDIRPTFDFQQEILWNGEDVEVMKPEWLRKEIAGKIKRMWNKYKEDKK